MCVNEFYVDFHLHVRLPSIAPWGKNNIFWIELKLESGGEPALGDLKLLFALLLLHGDKLQILHCGYCKLNMPFTMGLLWWLHIALCEFGESIV